MYSLNEGLLLLQYVDFICEGRSTYLYLSDKVITALVDGELERLNYLPLCEPAISKISYLKQREDAATMPRKTSIAVIIIRRAT